MPIRFNKDVLVTREDLILFSVRARSAIINSCAHQLGGATIIDEIAMSDSAVPVVALPQAPSRRKPWQAPEIEDVSVAMKTALCHASSNEEYQSSKDGS